MNSAPLRGSRQAIYWPQRVIDGSVSESAPAGAVADAQVAPKYYVPGRGVMR